MIWTLLCVTQGERRESNRPTRVNLLYCFLRPQRYELLVHHASSALHSTTNCRKMFTMTVVHSWDPHCPTLNRGRSAWIHNISTSIFHLLMVSLFFSVIYDHMAGDLTPFHDHFSEEAPSEILFAFSVGHVPIWISPNNEIATVSRETRAKTSSAMRDTDGHSFIHISPEKLFVRSSFRKGSTDFKEWAKGTCGHFKVISIWHPKNGPFFDHSSSRDLFRTGLSFGLRMYIQTISQIHWVHHSPENEWIDFLTIYNWKASNASASEISNFEGRSSGVTNSLENFRFPWNIEPTQSGHLPDIWAKSKPMFWFWLHLHTWLIVRHEPLV